jgi:hypothetical protein
MTQMRTLNTIIVLADISGYTKFVVMHRSSIVHAEQIITELMEVVTRNAEFPLKIQKLEGDAAFMTAEIGDDRRKAVNDITRQVVVFMDLYQKKQRELFEKSVGGCPCTACQSIENLKLKCVIHAGEVLEKEVGGHVELAGEPVIVAHRLMKNSVEADEYVLVTDAISQELEFEPYLTNRTYQETIKDVGTIRTKAYFPTKQFLARNGKKPLTRPRGNLEAMRLFAAGLLARLRGTRRSFQNLPT